MASLPQCTGTIAVWWYGASYPRACRPRDMYAALRSRFLRRSGSPSMISSAAPTVATADGGRLAENMCERATWRR